MVRAAFFLVLALAPIGDELPCAVDEQRARQYEYQHRATLPDEPVVDPTEVGRRVPERATHLDGADRVFVGAAVGITLGDESWLAVVIPCHLDDPVRDDFR